MIGRTAQAFDDAWTSRVPESADVAELVRVAERLCAAASIEPATDFRAALRDRLLAEAPLAMAPGVPVVRPQRRRLPAVSKVSAAGFAAAGLLGMVTASAQAMPGDPLYPIKRGVEQIQLALQPSEAGKSTAQLATAERRLNEATALASDASPTSQEHVAEALREFISSGTEGTNPLLAALEGPNQQALSDFVARATLLLAELKSLLPADAFDEYADAVDFVDSLAQVLSLANVDLGDALGTADAQAGTAKAPPTTSNGGAPSGSAAVVPAPAPASGAPLVEQDAVQEPVNDVTDTAEDVVEDAEGVIPRLLKDLLN